MTYFNRPITSITPNWPAPANINAYTTTRQGGVSAGPYASMNLSPTQGDAPEHVAANRESLQSQLTLPAQPCWLNQTHSTNIIPAHDLTAPVEGDASYTQQPGTVCVVLSGDCLPLLICDRKGTLVAAVHAGWRGMAAGIIENSVGVCHQHADELMVWLGPAISQPHYQVGDEVREEFLAHTPQTANAFQLDDEKKWRMDMVMLAKQRLDECGIAMDDIYGGDLCTYADATKFYSYRRDNITGRMASLIWLSQT